MAKIHRYVGLEGAKQIWKETGEKFIDNTEFDHVLDNIQMDFDGAELTLSIPSRTSNNTKKLTVDIRKLFGEPGELKKYLSPGEYDEETGQPNFEGSQNVIYLVPSLDDIDDPNDPDEYVEWVYDEDKGWEVVGKTPIPLDNISDIVNGL